MPRSPDLAGITSFSSTVLVVVFGCWRRQIPSRAEPTFPTLVPKGVHRVAHPIPHPSGNPVRRLREPRHHWQAKMHRVARCRNVALQQTRATSSRAGSSIRASRRHHATASAVTKPQQTQTQTPPPTFITSNQAPVDPFALLAPEMKYVKETLLNLLGSSHPSLSDIASYYFGLPGKQLRPLLVLLFASATNGFGSNYSDRLLARQNAQTGSLRNELDVTLTSPYILNDWNPRMPDYTSSFAEPFTIPSLQGRPSTFTPVKSSFTSMAPTSDATSASALHLPRSSSNILPTQLRLAQISEMIHVASLLHDDVLDDAATRRSAPSGPAAFGNKLSVLGGDFLLGRTSAALSRLGDHEVVELMSTIIANLIEGEIMQMRNGSNGTVHGSEATASGDVVQTAAASKRPQPSEFGHDVWTTYVRKSYFKTASLMAKSARSSVVLGGATTPGNAVDEELKDVAYAYGRNIGIAFQVCAIYLTAWQPWFSLSTRFITDFIGIMNMASS